MLQINKVKCLKKQSNLTVNKIYDVCYLDGERVFLKDDQGTNVWVSLENFEVTDDYFLP